MNKFKIFGVGWATLTLFSSHALAQSLWKGLSFGMNEQRIQSIFPNVIQKNPDLLILDGLKIEQCDIHVVLNMKNHALESVQVENGYGSGQIETCYFLMKSAVEAKYGKPIEEERDRMSGYEILRVNPFVVADVDWSENPNVHPKKITIIYRRESENSAQKML